MIVEVNAAGGCWSIGLREVVLMRVRRCQPDRDSPMRASGGHCQRKVDYFAPMPASYFTAVDFSRLFRIDSSGCTATSSIQNFPLTMPQAGHMTAIRKDQQKSKTTLA